MFSGILQFCISAIFGHVKGTDFIQTKEANYLKTTDIFILWTSRCFRDVLNRFQPVPTCGFSTRHEIRKSWPQGSHVLIFVDKEVRYIAVLPSLSSWY